MSEASAAPPPWFHSPVVAAIAAALLAGLAAGVAALTALSVETSTRISTLEKEVTARAGAVKDALANQQDRYSESLDRAAAKLRELEDRLRTVEIKEVEIRGFAEDMRSEMDRRAGLVSRVETLEGFRQSMNAYLGLVMSGVQVKEYERMNQEELDRRIRQYLGTANER